MHTHLNTMDQRLVVAYMKKLSAFCGTWKLRRFHSFQTLILTPSHLVRVLEELFYWYEKDTWTLSIGSNQKK
jgi:hypothetical protein